MAEAKAEAQESSSPRCLLLLAGGLQAACQAVSVERFCLLALASRLPTEHVSGRVGGSVSLSQMCGVQTADASACGRGSATILEICVLTDCSQKLEDLDGRASFKKV